jgi:hypothetical protein
MMWGLGAFTRPRLARASAWRHEVRRVLGALGGEGTLGDVVAVTGLPRAAVGHALEALLADGSGHVRVSASGDVVYHLADEIDAERAPARPSGGVQPGPAHGFDRKTAQLIRAREGVISLAELIEHTGLPLVEARVEMRRLAACFGGVPHASLDGHVVYAFPELVTSAHERLAAREPRPAWARGADPVRASRGGRLARWMRSLREACGLRRPADRATVRRHLLGLVTQTALAGKGVVSLERAISYLAGRPGARRPRRSVVERALRELADEFDAPITRLGDDLFFGFRNVKRQFLASHLIRRQTRLSRTATGATVFDTADPPLAASDRDLEAFDLMLLEARPHGHVRERDP